MLRCVVFSLLVVAASASHAQVKKCTDGSYSERCIGRPVSFGGQGTAAASGAKGSGVTYSAARPGQQKKGPAFASGGRRYSAPSVRDAELGVLKSRGMWRRRK